MSNQGWQNGGVKTENGVLGWREAEGSAGVKEYWSHGAVSLPCCAGPEAAAPRKAREANAGGKRWVGKWVDLGKGGRRAGKWTGFSQLFPYNSTQVVDFPRICSVSIFSGGVKNSRISGRGMIGRGMEMEGQAELGTHREMEYWSAGARRKLRVVTHCFAKVHEVSRKFAQNRPVNPRCCALLRVRPIFCQGSQENGNGKEREINDGWPGGATFHQF